MASAMEPMIKLQGVTKVFYTEEVETHALAGIHLEALRLWAKGEPIHDHPHREETPP